MTPADERRERWLDGGGSYQDLPEPVALEDTTALHPTASAEPPADWGTGPAALGGDDGD